MQMKKNQKSVPSGPDLKKEKVLEAYRIQHDIHLKLMEKINNDPIMTIMNDTPEIQREVMIKTFIEECYAQDQLFKETGVEDY